MPKPPGYNLPYAAVRGADYWTGPYNGVPPNQPPDGTLPFGDILYVDHLVDNQTEHFTTIYETRMDSLVFVGSMHIAPVI